MRLTGFGRYATCSQADLTVRLASKGSPAVQAKANLAMFRWSATEVLPQVTVPALVLAGSKGIVTLPGASEEIVQAGHMGFMERHDAYEAANAAFADDCFAAAGRPVPAPVRIQT